ncbi:BTB/POZ domain-containing protein [Ditylenchus destructor]|nr:BTB/POZ domain-containing protein [Ditylenchus destructor]
MSTTKGDYKVPNLSTQVTQMTPVSTKLKWRIEHFEKAMQFYKRDQLISSKTFTLPHPLTVTWRLDVYPHGRNGYSSPDNPHFYLTLTGFQAPDGSLSADGDKSIMAHYKIYLLSSTDQKRDINQGLSEFQIETTVGKYESKDTIEKFIHPGGSLLVVCEIESLVPEETFIKEPFPNSSFLDQIFQLTDQVKEMWKSKLFADCTVEADGKSFPVHKCILGQWSEVFRKMFSLPLEESKNGIVEIEDFSADSVSAMLEYMYTGVVQIEVNANGNLFMELLALADKYDVIPLKEMCEDFIASRLTTENFLQTAMLADRFSAAKLKKACINRLAINGRAALQSKEWEDLKNDYKDLANEILELMIKDNPSFEDMEKETK